MHVLYLESFYGGSHRSFADQWIEHSAHQFTLHTLPARFWKWRQAGSALFFAETIPENGGDEPWEEMVVSGMINLAQLKAIRADLPPALLYVHENQFSYPMAPGEEKDFRFGITDLGNMLCAEKVVFNSAYNRDSFLEELQKLWKRLPDAIPKRAIDTVRNKALVAYPGIEVHPAGLCPETLHKKKNEVPLIVWNHRHEHDKDFQTTFEVLSNLAAEGVDFNLALLGERYKKHPKAFDDMRNILGKRIIIDEYPSRTEYFCRLQQADVVVSSAIQENFGLSLIEAARCGCWPLAPNRLAYPEVLPLWAHKACLWNNKEDYRSKLESILTTPASARRKVTDPLSRWLRRYEWPERARILDELL